MKPPHPCPTDHIALAPQATLALAVLEQGGHEAWCVGGFVRDALLGRDAYDIDLATAASWQVVRDLFEARGFPVFETGVKHGTVTVVIDDMRLEITTYRSDGVYLDARHPQTVTFVRTIEEDLARRDFTINAIAYHPARGLCDPYGGRADIATHTLRAVGCARQRFAEDALRILRGIRFASQLGFSLEADTLCGMREQAQLMDCLAVERVAHELEGLLCGAWAHDALMAYVDVLATVMPEVRPLVGFDQKTPYHIYDVWEHTAYVVQNTPPYPLVRWAALFHDFGKPQAFFTDEAGVGHFYGHAALSVDVARTIMRRLKMSPRFAADVITLVKYHDDIIAPQPKAIKRVLQRLGGRVDLFRALCDLKRGDARSQAPHCHKRVALADELEATLDALLADEQAFSLRDLAIKGGDVIALGVSAGPVVGRILNAALDAVIEESVPNEYDALCAFVQGLRGDSARP
ncbi:MAG: HD domain-containing protein [Raoultibacter sp.]